MVNTLRVTLSNIEVMIPQVRKAATFTLQHMVVVLRSSNRLERSKERMKKAVARIFSEEFIQLQGDTKIPNVEVSTEKNGQRVEEEIFVLVQYESLKRRCFRIHMSNGDFSYEACQCPDYFVSDYIEPPAKNTEEHST